jgi:hypothetical protein
MIIPLFPLESGLFPGGLISLRIFEVRYLDMIKKAINDQSSFGLLMLKKGGEVRKAGVIEELMPIGTIAEILEINTLQPSLILIRCLGKKRFRLIHYEKVKYGLWQGEVEIIKDDPVMEIPPSLQSVADALGKFIVSMQRNGVTKEKMPILPPFRLDESGWVSNRWSELLSVNAFSRQKLLEEMHPNTRLKNVSQLLTSSPRNN